MTVVIGIIDGSRTHIASDSGTEDDDCTYISRESKIRDCDGYAVGVAGNARFCDTILHVWEPPRVQPDIPRWLRTIFLSSICKTFRVKAFEKLSEKHEDTQLELLIALPGDLWTLTQEGAFQDYMARGYAAIGSGAFAALGALHALRKEPVTTRLEVGLAAAQAICRSINPPWHYEIVDPPPIEE